MLLVVTVFPFFCALILFAYLFGKFAGKADTAEIASAMRQMNQAQIILFPGPHPEKIRARAAGA